MTRAILSKTLNNRRLHLCGAVALVLVLATQFISLSFLQQRIEAELSAATGTQASISPRITLGMLGLWPSVTLRDLTLKDARGNTLLSAAEAEAAIPLSPSPKNFRFRVEGLSAEGYSVTQIRLKLSMLDDGVDIPRLTVYAGQGEVTGQGRYSAGKLTATLAGEGIDYSFIDPGMRGGNMRLSLALTATGRDPDALLRSLTGRVLARGEDGTLQGSAVRLWAGNLVTSAFAAAKGADTKVLCTLADFDIKNGVAVTRALILDTPRVAVTGSGWVDLARQRLDLRLTPNPKEREILNLATPVKIEGSFKNPLVTPETAGALKKVGGLLLSAVNPAAALLPLLEKGKNMTAPCDAYLRKTGQENVFETGVAASP